MINGPRGAGILSDQPHLKIYVMLRMLKTYDHDSSRIINKIAHVSLVSLSLLGLRTE